MNYWPAEVCNLPECHQPLFELIRDISVAGATTAKAYYGASGWVTHHNIDLWRGTAPVDAARYGMWPAGGAWLCQHLWEHYAFTGDKQFLRENYPVMQGAAQFLLDVMVEEPKHHWLVTPFSMSPEHGYYDSSGKVAFLSPSPTMDVAIIRELFLHCIQAGNLLGVDEEFRAKLEAALTRIPPYQINRSGHLQEWIEDWKPGPGGHNMSPNFAFYPGSSITLRRDPPLAAAIAKWMETRRRGGGWPAAWDICVWARLERGDRVGAGMESFVRNSLAPNLHNRGSNQSDANFGFTAAVAEALLQSHAGEISLLPALPPSWTDGSVDGLRARGGFELDMQWKNGKLQSAEIRSKIAATCKVRYGTKTADFTLEPGEPIHLNADLVNAGPRPGRNQERKPGRDGNRDAPAPSVMQPSCFRRDVAVDAATTFGRADTEHEVIEFAASLLVAPTRPIDDLFAVELVELDVDTVCSQRLRESQHSRTVLRRIVVVANEGGNPAHNSGDYTPRPSAAESMGSSAAMAPVHLTPLRPTGVC